MRMKKLTLLVALFSLTIMLIPFASANFSDVTICKTFYCDIPTEELPLNTFLEWGVQITITNNNPYTVTNVVLNDRFGAEFAVHISWYSEGFAEPILYTKGTSDKVFLVWDIGSLAPGQSARIQLYITTDINPAGRQEFTSCGTYYINSGAVVKWLDNFGHKNSAETPPLVVSTLPA